MVLVNLTKKEIEAIDKCFSAYTCLNQDNFGDIREYNRTFNSMKNVMKKVKN